MAFRSVPKIQQTDLMPWDSQYHRDARVVPLLGGEPQRWLKNASGVVWTGQRRVLFSNSAAEKSRIRQRDVYVDAAHARVFGERDSVDRSPSDRGGRASMGLGICRNPHGQTTGRLPSRGRDSKKRKSIMMGRTAATSTQRLSQVTLKPIKLDSRLRLAGLSAPSSLQRIRARLRRAS
ncbi:MAG: hypothetical protein ABSH45_17505, partial [Bryobacteraceae bacterium]